MLDNYIEPVRHLREVRDLDIKPAPPLRNSAMTLTPHDLLDVSIAQLSTLASFLTEEMSVARDRAEVATPEVRACQEILLTIRVLIPKLQATRYVMPRDELSVRTPQPG